MEKKSVFERLFEWIRGWLRRLLRVLFPEDVLDHIRQAHAESDSSGADETAIGTDPPELTEEETRIYKDASLRLYNSVRSGK